MYMKLSEFVSQYTLEDILKIEHNDSQNQVIKRAWESIRHTYGDTKVVRQSFLYILLQTALVSYQIAGSWPLWWDEITQKIISDFDRVFRLFLSGESTDVWWYETLTNSKYNKRLYNNKSMRMLKFHASYQMFDVEVVDYFSLYQDMEKLLGLLAVCMKTDRSAKTISFAVKIFGYGARRVYDQMILYPMGISIPLDSRLRTIGRKEHGEISDKDLLAWYNQLWQDVAIPPLHLDSLLWLEYWEKYGKR